MRNVWNWLAVGWLTAVVTAAAVFSVTARIVVAMLAVILLTDLSFFRVVDAYYEWGHQKAMKQFEKEVREESDPNR